MRILLILMITLVVVACSPNIENESEHKIEVSNKFKVLNDSVFKTYNKQVEISSAVFSSAPKRVVILATPLFSYIKALGVEDNVAGILSLNRLKNISPAIKSVGENSEVDQERIIALSPDLIICNSYQLKSLLRIKSKYQILVVDEYAESNPLKKSSWIAFFGALFHKGKKGAEIYFNIVSKYEAFPIENKRIIQLNNYAGKWYLPGCNSYISKLIKDSGGKVDCDSEKVGSDVISEEAAMVKLNELDYLLFFDWEKDTSGLKLRLKPVLDLVKRKQLNVLYCNTIQTNFFDESILKPNVIIGDLNRLITKEKNGTFFKLITLEN